MDNWLMILMSVGMIVLLIGPFVIISAITGRKTVHRKLRKK